MSSLEQDRKTDELVVFDVASPFEFPVDADAKIFGGALACLDSSGNVVEGATSTGLKALGRCERLADNTDGEIGDINARVKPGVFKWDNSEDGDLIDNADKGSVCYIVDDHTVALTDGGATRSKAGVVVFVDDDGGVFVATGFEFFSNPAATPSGTLAKKTVTVLYTTFTATADGVDENENVGTALPAGAFLVGSKYTINTPFVGAGVATLTMIVGMSGDTNGVIEAVDILGDAAAQYSGVQGTSMQTLQSGTQLVANFDPDNASGLDELTAGSVTIDVYYFVTF